MTSAPVVIGIDVGTQGARVVAHDPTGMLVDAVRERFTGDWWGPEQDPEAWWAAVTTCLQRLMGALGEREIAGISVTSTSGTVIAFDAEWQPLGPALMYSDRRSADVSTEIDRHFPYLGVNASWGLPKIVWFEARHPDLAKRIHAWRHPGDFLIGRLTGEWGKTDQTTALKSGFDVARNQWPLEVLLAFGVEREKFPAVGISGQTAGYVTDLAALQTGLPAGTPVLLGMTDGCASQVGSGAVRPGEWNSTIGTTLVVKGTTVKPIVDPLGRIYNHRHPQGFWMPGAASNTGAAWVSSWFPDRDPADLDRMAAGAIPTGMLTYPLIGRGERFPFVCESASGFGYDGSHEAVRVGSAMEGVAYLERMAFDLVEELSGEQVTIVSTAGGGSAGETWLRIRANVLDRPIRRVRNANAAAGAAMIAASGVWYPDLVSAVDAMMQLESVIEPDGLAEAYREGYERFREDLERRGYLAQDAGLS